MPEAGGPPARGATPRPPRPQPGNEPTTAIPTQGTPPEGRARPRPQNADATTAIPTQRKQDAEAATEKLNTREEEEPKRRGSGVSAQDLLRREGRI
jgi:RND superfamily putative drug exporter